MLLPWYDVHIMYCAFVYLVENVDRELRNVLIIIDFTLIKYGFYKMDVGIQFYINNMAKDKYCEPPLPNP